MRLLMAAAVAMLCLATSARAEWFEARSDHFRVYTDGTSARARNLVTKLERFDAVLRSLLNLKTHPSDLANPLTVFEVDNITQVEQLCRSLPGTGKTCQNTAGFYEGRVSGSVAFVPQTSGSASDYGMSAQTILFHEYAHHLMLSNNNVVYPAWYVEGFAEFMSTAKFQPDNKLGIGLPAMHRAMGLAYGSPLKISELLTASPNDLKPEKRESLYGRGWLLTHYLALEPSKSGQLTAYLEAINRGTPNLEAARANFGDLSKLDKELDAYMNRPRLGYLAFPLALFTINPVNVRALRPGEAAIMPVRWRSERAVDDSTAPIVASAARKLAAPYPNDADVQNVLLEAEFDANNLSEADAAADRALAADPADMKAMIYKAMIAMRRAKSANLRDEASWKQVRVWLSKANKVQNDAAWPLVLFYISYRQQGVVPSANAIAALERGQELVPQDRSVRFMLVMEYLRQEKLSEARSVLAPLAFDPHIASNSRARKLYDLIDTGNKAAIRLFLSAPDGPDDNAPLSPPVSRPDPG